MPLSSTKNSHCCHVHKNNPLGSWSLPLLLLCSSVASQDINQRKLTGYAILKFTFKVGTCGRFKRLTAEPCHIPSSPRRSHCQCWWQKHHEVMNFSLVWVYFCHFLNFSCLCSNLHGFPWYWLATWFTCVFLFSASLLTFIHLYQMTTSSHCFTLSPLLVFPWEPMICNPFLPFFLATVFPIFCPAGHFTFKNTQVIQAEVSL